VEVTVTVRNPLPRPATLEVRLVGPQGWQGTSATAMVVARAEAPFQLSITPDGPCRRQPFVAEVVADGRPLGQVTEALLTRGRRYVLSHGPSVNSMHGRQVLWEESVLESGTRLRNRFLQKGQT